MVGHNDYLNQFTYFNPWIFHTGLVTWVPEVKLHTKCFIKITDFPFDVQCCEINFYSWAHTASQMIIKQYGNKNTTNLTHLAYNTEWVIYKTCALNTTITTSKDLHWWMTKYVLYMRRESIYHIYTLLMPCVVLSMLSILLFLLPPDSDEKITLGVTILLAFFVNSLVVSNYTPEAASELPVIGIYYTFNIFHVALSLSASVLILKMHFRGHKLNKVPEWVKKILLIDSKALKKGRSHSTLLNLNKSHSQNLFISVREPLNHFKDSKTIELAASGEVTKKCRKSNHSDFKYIDYNLYKIIRLIKASSKKSEIEIAKYERIEDIKVEWKEVAARLENIFLVISLVTIFSTPIYLFSKYFRHDYINLNSTSCGCDL